MCDRSTIDLVAKTNIMRVESDELAQYSLKVRFLFCFFVLGRVLSIRIIGVSQLEYLRLVVLQHRVLTRGKISAKLNVNGFRTGSYWV